MGFFGPPLRLRPGTLAPKLLPPDRRTGYYLAADEPFVFYALKVGVLWFYCSKADGLTIELRAITGGSSINLGKVLEFGSIRSDCFSFGVVNRLRGGEKRLATSWFCNTMSVLLSVGSSGHTPSTWAWKCICGGFVGTKVFALGRGGEGRGGARGDFRTGSSSII